jgi:hypothetical protein
MFLCGRGGSRREVHKVRNKSEVYCRKMNCEKEKKGDLMTFFSVEKRKMLLMKLRKVRGNECL